MKKIELYLVKRRYSNERYKLYMIEEGESLDKELFKLLPEQLEEAKATFIRLFCDGEVDKYIDARVFHEFEVKEVEPDRLLELLGR